MSWSAILVDDELADDIYATLAIAAAGSERTGVEWCWMGGTVSFIIAKENLSLCP